VRTIPRNAFFLFFSRIFHVLPSHAPGPERRLSRYISRVSTCLRISSLLSSGIPRQAHFCATQSQFQLHLPFFALAIGCLHNPGLSSFHFPSAPPCRIGIFPSTAQPHLEDLNTTVSTETPLLIWNPPPWVPPFPFLFFFPLIKRSSGLLVRRVFTTQKSWLQPLRFAVTASKWFIAADSFSSCAIGFLVAAPQRHLVRLPLSTCSCFRKMR